MNTPFISSMLQCAKRSLSTSPSPSPPSPSPSPASPSPSPASPSPSPASPSPSPASPSPSATSPSPASPSPSPLGAQNPSTHVDASTQSASRAHAVANKRHAAALAASAM